MITSTTGTEQNKMTKPQLKIEINAYIQVFGYSIENACKQVNNLYLNKYLNKIFDIQNEMLAEAA